MPTVRYVIECIYPPERFRDPPKRVRVAFQSPMDVEEMARLEALTIERGLICQFPNGGAPKVQYREMRDGEPERVDDDGNPIE